jgi:hypothetical protein
LKEFGTLSLEKAFFGQESSGPVFIKHIHDEALMRLRSLSSVDVPNITLPQQAAVGGAGFSRSRSSKIQNNIISIAIGSQVLPWLCELQPLAKKDGDTVGLALVQSVQEIMRVLSSDHVGGLDKADVRVLHCLTGDGINTNEAAAKRLHWHYTRSFRGRCKYFLIVLRCASHQANLCVQAALCGRILRQPLEQDELCANCSRFFKHLLADHCDEYAAALRSHVIGRLQFREYGPDEHIPSVSPMSRSLLTLYGRDIIPEVFTDVFNHETFSWEHHCHAGADRLFLRGRAFAAVYRWTLKTEEKPVITRFWLFTECVFAVLRMKMLALPSSLFDVGCRSESQHRVAAFKTWYDDPGTDKHLRKAALCLRLTLFATNLTAKSNRDPKARPMLVRLADGEIQRRTSELLLTMLPLLGGDAQLDVEAVVFGFSFM